jgi:hypothetical protein
MFRYIGSKLPVLALAVMSMIPISFLLDLFTFIIIFHSHSRDESLNEMRAGTFPLSLAASFDINLFQFDSFVARAAS